MVCLAYVCTLPDRHHTPPACLRHLLRLRRSSRRCSTFGAEHEQQIDGAKPQLEQDSGAKRSCGLVAAGIAVWHVAEMLLARAATNRAASTAAATASLAALSPQLSLAHHGDIGSSE